MASIPPRIPLLQRLPMGWRIFLVFATLYLFLVGIGGMSAAIKALGKGQAEALLGGTTHPLTALFMGILVTTLVQSSSTSTSLVVAAVATGTIELHVAVFMVMGANVGTTVTNTLVSLGHITRSNEYQRAFAAATVHDFFNIMVLLVIFPLEVATGALSNLAQLLTEGMRGFGVAKFASPLKVVTEPTIDLLEGIGGALGPSESAEHWIFLILSVILMFSMLIGLVKTLKAVMMEKLENLFDRTIFKTRVRSLSFGLALTVLVQSSSVTTSLAVPLVGAGVLNIRQVFPYTMGANIGTTCTGLLAAFGVLAAADKTDTMAIVGLTVALFHVMFNVFGVAIFWCFQEAPIRVAEWFARLAMKNRMIPVFYIVITFYVIPAIIVAMGT